MIARLNKWILISILALIWGSSFILIKKGLQGFRPEQVGSMRLMFAWLAFLPFVLFKFKEIPWKKVKYIAGVGLFGNGIPAFLFAMAQTKVPSSVAGTLNGLTPLFALLIGISLFKLSFSLAKISGVVIGFLGAVLLVWGNTPANVPFSTNGYALFIVLATCMYGLSVNILKKYLQEINPIMISAVAFSIIGPPAAIYLFSTDFLHTLSTQPGAYAAMGYISILAVVGTSFALIIFNILIQKTDVVTGSVVTYLIPIVSVIWGMLDGEIFTMSHFLGLVLVLTGVWLSSKKRTNLSS